MAPLSYRDTDRAAPAVPQSTAHAALVKKCRNECGERRGPFEEWQMVAVVHDLDSGSPPEASVQGADRVGLKARKRKEGDGPPMNDETPDPQGCDGYCRCPRCGHHAVWSLIYFDHTCENRECGYRFKEHDPKVFDGVRFRQPKS